MTTMLDRFRRSSSRAEKADQKSAETSTGTPTGAPPPSAGPDEETVRIARKDFRKRRNAGRWRLVRRLVLALLLLGLVAGSVWVVLFSSYVTAREVDVVGRDCVPARLHRDPVTGQETVLSQSPVRGLDHRTAPEQGHGGRLRNGNAFSTAATAASEDHLVAAAVCEAAEAHVERCRPATASGTG